MSSWNTLDSDQGLDNIIEESRIKPQLILKHSTSCSISHIAKMRLDESLDELQKHLDCHYLDLLRYRSISNRISNELNLHHESPQILVVNQGEVTYDESHLDISMKDIIEHLSFLKTMSLSR